MPNSREGSRLRISSFSLLGLLEFLSKKSRRDEKKLKKGIKMNKPFLSCHIAPSKPEMGMRERQLGRGREKGFFSRGPEFALELKEYQHSHHQCTIEG